MSQEILRRKSWDAEATPEELAATESLIARIKALQNTQGQELSGVQIIAHFLRIRVQPLQARASPLWLYSGAGDATRISTDLSVKDLEKLVRRFTSLSKKSPVPTSCRVVPFSGTHALPAVNILPEFFLPLRFLLILYLHCVNSHFYYVEPSNTFFPSSNSRRWGCA